MIFYYIFMYILNGKVVIQMNDLLCKFENLVVLKTIMDNIDLNFIGTNDLDNIAIIANDLDIDLNFIDYDHIEYNDQYQDICDVYMDWFDDVNTMYLDVKNSLLKLI